LAASQQFGANNQTDVFLVDTNGQLNVFWVQGEGAWNGPVKIGPAGFAPAGLGLAASQQFGANSQTDVFLVDRNGQVNVFWVQREGPWNGPVKIGPAGLVSPRGAFYNVRYYGAAGSGATLDTNAVNAAIDAAYNAGGGTVYFPAGAYLCFTIRLRSNVQLYLEQGCVILAADSPKPGEATGQLAGQYDPAGFQDQKPWTFAPYQQYQDYGHNHWANSLLYGEGESNLGVGGPGLIDGKGLASGNFSLTPPQNGQPGWGYNAEQAGVGNKAIGLKNCNNVILRDFSIREGGHFGLLLTGVNNVTVDNLKIDTNRDGMDIDCCTNVRVSNCTVNSPWDDGICLKSSYALDALVSTQDVTIASCAVSGCYEMGAVLNGSFAKFTPGSGVPQCGRIKYGTESNGGCQRIAISNCLFEGCNGLAIESVDGAICEDITVTNLTMRDLVSGPLFFCLGDRLRAPAGTSVGVLRRISVQNVVASNCNEEYTNILTGIPGHDIEDIHIAGFYMQQRGGGTAQQAQTVPPEHDTPGIGCYPDPTAFGPIPAQGFFLRHIRGLVVSQAQIAAVAPDARYAFVLQDVYTSWFQGIMVPTYQNSPMGFAFWPVGSPQIGDFHIHLSQAMADTDIS
jgi:polygalacturonase